MFILCSLLLFTRHALVSGQYFCRCDCCAGARCQRQHLETFPITDCDACSASCQSQYPHLCHAEHSSYNVLIQCGSLPPQTIGDEKLAQSRAESFKEPERAFSSSDNDSQRKIHPVFDRLVHSQAKPLLTPKHEELSQFSHVENTDRSIELPSLFDVVHAPASTAHPLTHSSSRSPSTTKPSTTHRTTSHSRQGISLPMRAQHPHPSPKPRCAIGSEKVLKNHRDRRAQNDLPFVINEAAIQHLIDVAQAAGDKIVVPAVDAQTNFIDSITDHGQNPINGYVLPATTKKTKKSNNHPDSDDENSGQDRLVGSLVNLCSMIMLIVCAHFF